MARIKWQGPGIEGLIHQVQVYVPEVVMPELVGIMQDTVQEAHALQETALNQAVTTYGSERYGAGRGGSAGRNDTGQMIDEISDSVTSTANTVTGTWGWDELTDKIAAQEFGLGNPPAAHSLHTSFVPAREALNARLQKVT